MEANLKIIQRSFHLKGMMGSALLVVMGFVLVLSLIIASFLDWTGTESVMISRRSSRMDALYGAESAVRRSMAQIRALYLSNYSGNSYLTGNLAAPTDSDIATLTSSQGPATLPALNNNYTYSLFTVAFTTGTSTNRYVSYSIPATDTNLTTYAGLTSQRATILCSAQAVSKNARYAVPMKVSQKFNIDYIPVFQYAIFYNTDLEVFNGPNMTVNGKVDANGTIYYAPANPLAVQNSLVAMSNIERGIKVWDSSKPKLLSQASSSIQAQYQNNQSLYAADKANWVAVPPTIGAYGQGSFQVTNATTGQIGSNQDFRTSTNPLTFFDSNSSGWAGGATTKWGGGVKSKDQGATFVSPPVPSDVLASSPDPTNPYHVMIENPVLNGSGVSTESTSMKSAKMAYNATLLVQRSGASVIFRLKDANGNWHQVNNLRDASTIVTPTTTTLRDQREYLQNGGVKMTVTDLNVAALYGDANGDGVISSFESTHNGAMDNNGVWQSSAGTPINTDVSGQTFNPVPFDGTVYIYDDNFSSSRKPAIRIKNGTTIFDKDSNPSANNGIAIISQNPVYVQGNFNSDGNITTGPEKSDSGKENAPPALIAADVVSVLSTSWTSAKDDPSGSASNYFGRTNGGNTEINAAILAGVNLSSQNVTANSFDGTTGGVNNFTHFLEAWNGTFKYSGSMVSLWYGKQATSTYRGAGTTWGVFSAPTRNWAFDTDFLNPNKLPRCTPLIRVYSTADWSNY